MRVRTSRGFRTRLRQSEDAVVLGLMILLGLTASIVGTYSYAQGALGFDVLVGLWTTFVVSLVGFLYFLIRKRRQAALISITSAYLLGSYAGVDRVLGKLIAGKLDLREVDPVDTFFASIKSMCEHGTVEMRRRVSEALPALLSLDIDLGTDVAETLRMDFDETWRSDNRRRAVEALPHLLRVDRETAESMLQLREGDEIFVCIAITEVLNLIRFSGRKPRAEAMFSALKESMRHSAFPESEMFAVTEFWDLLEDIHRDPDEAAGRFSKLKSSDNLYLRICVARNLRLLCGRSQTCIPFGTCQGNAETVLDMVEYFLRDDEHRYVRRPMAREVTLECLTHMLRLRRWKARVGDILLRMIADGDDIIRITVFDKIENISDADPELGQQIVRYVAENEIRDELRTRAQALMA